MRLPCVERWSSLVTIVGGVLLLWGSHIAVAGDDDADPAQVAIGERLFLETRFAQFFFARAKGDADAILPVGDPVLDVTETLDTPLRGPFAGQSMNCRTCHLVDEQGSAAGGGNRTYADFARRSPLPARDDANTHTPRNAPPLVNTLLVERRDLLLHFDGEFATVRDLVKSTLTGRNLGWLPQEQHQAVAHIAQIIRDDDGSGDLAREFGGAYAVVLKGTDPGIPPAFRLPVRLRIDVTTASDEEILEAVAKLIEAYLHSLVFAQDAEGAFNGSPYDRLLCERTPLACRATCYPRRLRSSRRQGCATSATQPPTSTPVVKTPSRPWWASTQGCLHCCGRDGCAMGLRSLQEWHSWRGISPRSALF